MALEDPGTIEEGDPAVIRAEADELKTVAANLHTVVNLLRTVSTKGVWDSCSGTMFEREVGTTPSDLVQVLHRSDHVRDRSTGPTPSEPWCVGRWPGCS